MNYHTPVLLKEVIEHLKIKKDGLYIDATLGDAGHALEILKMGGKVLGIEINSDALERATSRISELGLLDNFKGVLGNFKNIDQIAEASGFGKIDGIIFDLGYSSFELENDELALGLSFLKDEPLDMRLDKTLGVTAADLVNALNENQLAELIREYSDERLARKFAKAILKHRNLRKIQTTKELADLLKSEASPGYENGRIHPATRTFQALRIAVNCEKENLEIALPRAARLLLPYGRMLVISFHSMEDRITKTFGRGARLLKEVTSKPVVPTEDEITQNVRARSAKLRIFEKTNAQ